jgi:hypothetical protein
MPYSVTQTGDARRDFDVVVGTGRDVIEEYFFRGATTEIADEACFKFF